MRKKVIGIIFVLMVFLLASCSSAVTINTKQILENKQVPLGTATIIGTGVEEESVVEVTVENDLLIGIDSTEEYVDFTVEYSMSCTAPFDDGRVYLLVQLNGENLELKDATTQDVDSGTIVLENIFVSRGDIITYEIGAAYSNLNPPFTIPVLEIGGGTFDRQYNLFEKFPILSYLFERFPLLSSIILK